MNFCFLLDINLLNILSLSFFNSNLFFDVCFSNRQLTVYFFSSGFENQLVYLVFMLALVGIVMSGSGKPILLAKRPLQNFDSTFVLVLIASTGWFFLATITNALTFFVLLELMSLLPIIFLTALNSETNGSVYGYDVAIKYFIWNLFVGSMHLVGVFIIYYLTGSLSFIDWAAFLATLEPGLQHNLISIATILFFFPFFFKIGLFPFHWIVGQIYSAMPSRFLAVYASFYKFGVFFVFWFLIVNVFFSLLSSPVIIAFFLWLVTLTLLIALIMVFYSASLKAVLGFMSLASSSMAFVPLFSSSIGFGAVLDAASLSLFSLFVYAICVCSLFIYLNYVSRATASRPVWLFAADSPLTSSMRPTKYVIVLLFFLVSGLPPTIFFWFKLNMLSLLFFNGFGFTILMFLIAVNIFAPFAYFWLIRFVFFDNMPSAMNSLMDTSNVSNASLDAADEIFSIFWFSISIIIVFFITIFFSNNFLAHFSGILLSL